MDHVYPANLTQEAVSKGADNDLGDQQPSALRTCEPISL